MKASKSYKDRVHERRTKTLFPQALRIIQERAVNNPKLTKAEKKSIANLTINSTNIPGFTQIISELAVNIGLRKKFKVKADPSY